MRAWIRSGCGVVVLIGVLLLAACGSGGSSSSSSGKPAVCQDLTSFNTALHDLTSINVRQNGLSSIKPALQKVQETGKALVNSARAQFKSDAQGLQTAINQLESTVQSLGQQSSVSNTASALADSVQSVVNTGTKLVDEVTSTCK